MRPLHRLHLHRHVLEGEILAGVVERLVRQPLQHDVEHFGEALRASRRIDAKIADLVWRDAAADSELQSTAAHLVEHANLVDQPQRMIEVERVDQRAEAQCLRALGDGGEEHAGRGGHAERRRMVFGDVIGVETALLVELDQLQPLLELPAEIAAGAVHVVEDAEFHHSARLRLLITPLAMPCHSIEPDSRECSILGQRSITTFKPAFSARLAASSFTTPSCIHTTLAPCLIASSVIGPAACELRKMSTMSTFCGSSSSVP